MGLGCHRLDLVVWSRAKRLQLYLRPRQHLPATRATRALLKRSERRRPRPTSPYAAWAAAPRAAARCRPRSSFVDSLLADAHDDIRRHWALPAAAACEAGAPRSPSSPAALSLRVAPGRHITGARAAATMLAHFPFAARTPRVRSAARALLASRRPATSRRRPSLSRCRGIAAAVQPPPAGQTPPGQRPNRQNEPPPLRRAAPVALSRCVRSRSRGQRSFGPRGDPVLAVRGGRGGARGGRLVRCAPRPPSGTTLPRSPVAVLRA